MRLRILIMAVVSVLIVGSVVGQDFGNKVSVSYSVKPAPQVTVTNNSTSRLTGLVIVVSGTVGQKRVRETIWLDSGLNFKHDRPLESNESRAFNVANFEAASALNPELKAVTFEDQSSAGDSEWLARFHARRKAAYDEIGAVTTLLNQALAQHETNEQIVSALNEMRTGLQTSIPDVKTRIAAGLVIETAVSNLQRGGVRGSVGDPQKTIPSVLIPLFSDWREALKHNDKNAG